MLKPILGKYFLMRNNALREGYDTALLTKGQDGKYYRVKEYIVQVVSIWDQIGWNGMDRVKVRLFNNENYITETYLDDNIREGDIISIYGIFIQKGEQLELQCKAGSIRAFNKFSEAGRIETSKIYKFGYAELSVAEPSIPYETNTEKIQELEKDRLWIYVGNDIKSIEEQYKHKKEEEKNGIIDTTTATSFYVDDTEEILEEFINEMP